MEASSAAPRETHCTQLSRNSRPSMSYRKQREEKRKRSLCVASWTLRTRFSFGGAGLELRELWDVILNSDWGQSSNVTQWAFLTRPHQYCLIKFSAIPPTWHHLRLVFYDIMLRFGIVQTTQKADIERGYRVIFPSFFIFYVHDFLTFSAVTKEIQ